jgi:hypothetical protein
VLQITAIVIAVGMAALTAAVLRFKVFADARFLEAFASWLRWGVWWLRDISRAVDEALACYYRSRRASARLLAAIRQNRKAEILGGQSALPVLEFEEEPRSCGTGRR